MDADVDRGRMWCRATVRSPAATYTVYFHAIGGERRGRLLDELPG